jgi:hypothetical protein
MSSGRIDTTRELVPGEGIELSWVPRASNASQDYTDRPEVTDAIVWATQWPGTRWSKESGSRTRNTSRRNSGTSGSPPRPTRTSSPVPLRVPVGLRQGVHSPGLVLFGNLGIDRRGLDAAVAALLLDHFQGGAAGPIEMGGVVRIQPHGRHEAFDHPPDAMARQCTPLARGDRYTGTWDPRTPGDRRGAGATGPLSGSTPVGRGGAAPGENRRGREPPPRGRRRWPAGSLGHVACLTDWVQSSARDRKSLPADKGWEHNKVPISPERDFTHPAARPQEVSGAANAEGYFGSTVLLCRSLRGPDRVSALFAVSEIPEPRPPLLPPSLGNNSRSCGLGRRRSNGSAIGRQPKLVLWRGRRRDHAYLVAGKPGAIRLAMQDRPDSRDWGVSKSSHVATGQCDRSRSPSRG